jgi:hypothetical protein
MIYVLVYSMCEHKGTTLNNLPTCILAVGMSRVIDFHSSQVLESFSSSLQKVCGFTQGFVLEICSEGHMKSSSISKAG